MNCLDLLAVLFLCLPYITHSNKPKISVKKGVGGAYNINLGDPDPPEDKKESDERNKIKELPWCDLERGCFWEKPNYKINAVLTELQQKIFTRTEETIEQLENLYYGEKLKEMDDALLLLATSRTVQAALGGEKGDKQGLCENTLAKSVRHVDQMNRKDTRKLQENIKHEISCLSNLQSKLLLVRQASREKLLEKIGEHFFLQGKLLLAREAFLLALRAEGSLDTKLSIVSRPSTIIKKVMCVAIEHEYLSSGTCEKDTDENCITSSYSLGQQTSLNNIFWGDVTRSITHEKLEWWLAKAKNMAFSHLTDGIYKAGVESGVYLSRYQRPINAVAGLRAKPVWELKETGMKKALDKIKENWKVIRDEGLELMKQRKRWRVDPGWVGLPDSRGWWGEIAVKGVALHSAQEQADLCRNALFTCRMIQQFPEASGCPKCKASFSLVDGHTVIPAHAGPTNARLRAHLGLQVPKKGDVHLRIANQTVGWKPGKWTIIDDSFEHEIINESKSQRLILLVDFMHPDISKNNKENKEEFNWSREDMKNTGLARNDYIVGGFPE